MSFDGASILGGTQVNSSCLNQPDVLIQIMEEKDEQIAAQTVEKQAVQSVSTEVVSIVDMIRFNQQIQELVDNQG